MRLFNIQTLYEKIPKKTSYTHSQLSHLVNTKTVTESNQTKVLDVRYIRKPKKKTKKYEKKKSKTQREGSIAYD